MNLSMPDVARLVTDAADSLDHARQQLDAVPAEFVTPPSPRLSAALDGITRLQQSLATRAAHLQATAPGSDLDVIWHEAERALRHADALAGRAQRRAHSALMAAAQFQDGDLPPGPAYRRAIEQAAVLLDEGSRTLREIAAHLTGPDPAAPAAATTTTPLPRPVDTAPPPPSPAPNPARRGGRR